MVKVIEFPSRDREQRRVLSEQNRRNMRDYEQEETSYQKKGIAEPLR